MSLRTGLLYSASYALQCVGVALMLCCHATAQTLDDRLDDERFLRGLIELRLPEVLQRYTETHPPADAVEAALYDIAAARIALNEAALSSAERRAALERIAQLRRDLIDQHPHDARRAVWIADLASELLFEHLVADGLGLTGLFGLPTAEQRERAQRLSREIHERAAQAESALEQAILELESAPGFIEDAAAQQRRRTLVERERQRRIPFLRGAGAVLHAELSVDDHAERRAIDEHAVDALEAATELLEGSVGATARVYAGLAAARLGEFDAAEARFEQAARDPDASQADMFAARMGGVLNRARNRGLQAALAALDSIEPRYTDADLLFFRVLIVDQRFLVRRAMALNAQNADRPALMAQAIEAYTDLLKTAPMAGVGSPTLRAIIFARLTTAADYIPPDIPLDSLPAIVRVGRAQQMARDPATREQAIVMLEESLKGDALDDLERTLALFALARALYEQNHRLFAAQRFIELARNHPTDAQAERAIEFGVSIAEALHRADPADGDARRALRDGLDVMLERYINLPSVDRWRYVAGRLALDEGRFEEAASRFAQIGPGAPQHLAARFMEVAVVRAQAASRDGAEPHEQVLSAINRAMPLLEAGAKEPRDPEHAADIHRFIALLRIYRGQALIELGRPQQALDAVALIEGDAGSLDAGVIAEALKARIAAYQALRRAEDAQREIERFIQTAPEQAGMVLAPMLGAMERDVLALIESNQAEEAAELARKTMLPIARLLESWMNSRAGEATHRECGLRIADTYRHSGEFEDALQWYETLLRDEPAAEDLLVGRAESLFHLGGEARLAEAVTLYKRIAAGADAPGHTYWLAQLRMLQIIDLVNRRTDQILPRIEQLRQRDSEFGGERFRRGFDALRTKYTK